MSITNIQTLHDLAETTLASYATLLSNQSLNANLQNQSLGANFVAAQADAFVAKYQFLNQQSNVELNGFSATVFLDKQTGEKVFALRGTEFTQGLGQVLVDGLVADGLGIGGSGYANLQGVEMYRYWKKLTTIGGQSVSYTDAELLTLYALKLGPIAGAAILLTPIGQIGGIAGFGAFKAGIVNDIELRVTELRVRSPISHKNISPLNCSNG